MHAGITSRNNRKRTKPNRTKHTPSPSSHAHFLGIVHQACQQTPPLVLPISHPYGNAFPRPAR